MSIIDNLPDKTAKDIYYTYKSRCEIEQFFDSFKNTMHVDSSYMHSVESLRGWMFINHLAMSAFYRIYNKIKSKELLNKISVNDIITHLVRVNVIKINESCYHQEKSSKTAKFFDNLDLNYILRAIDGLRV